MSDIEDILRKVQALLARADHPNTPVPEADSCRAKAEILMTKYRIEETQLSDGGQAPPIEPKWVTWRLCRYESEFRIYYESIYSAVLRHFGIRGVVMNVYNKETGEHDRYARCVGYESDVRFAEALFTSCQLAFQARLEPRYDPSLSAQENAYVMRSAGMEGWRIAQAIFGRDDKSLRPKVRAMFKKEALARGEDPSVLLGRGNSVKAFREDYALGFVRTIQDRLDTMRTNRAQAEVGLVLKDREERIVEKFYEEYPAYRPATNRKDPYVSPNEGCEKCANAKSGYCREHQWLKPRKPKAGRSLNWSAYDRGSDAARTVDLGGSGSQINE